MKPLTKNQQLVWLNESDHSFPDARQALLVPDGLLAAGGDLSLPRLLNAYRQGIFPWYEEGQPILWWSPDPRSVIEPGAMRITRRLARKIRQGDYEIRIDSAFTEVVDACRNSRGEGRTWITPEMKTAYIQMHEAGYAHSFECYMDGQLAGGLYGVSLGNLFFGESMFFRVSDASKIAFAHLLALMKEVDSPLVDCQVTSPHLTSLGAREIPRNRFLDVLTDQIDRPPIDWRKWRDELASHNGVATGHWSV